MQVARTLALACLVLGAQVAPAEAFTISLRQVGGTAVGGVGYVGGDVVVSIDVVVESSDSAVIVAAALQWDLEGGNVLDLVRANGDAERHWRWRLARSDQWCLIAGLAGPAIFDTRAGDGDARGRGPGGAQPRVPSARTTSPGSCTARIGSES